MSLTNTSNQTASTALFRPEVTAALSAQWLGAIRLAQPNILTGSKALGNLTRVLYMLELF